MLNINNIQKHLNDTSIRIELFDKVDSTNTYLKNINGMDAKYLLCLAEKQTAGYGQYQRQWASPANKNIYLSLRTTIGLPITQLSGLSLVVGLSVYQALEFLWPILSSLLTIKWPNDIYCNGEKLGGILVEVIKSNDSATDVVIGLGLNVNTHKKDMLIDQSWTSVSMQLQQDVDRNILIAKIVKTIINNLSHFSENGFNHFMAYWHGKDFLINKNIHIKIGNDLIVGQCQGVNDKGLLLLKNNLDQMQAIASGQIVKID